MTRDNFSRLALAIALTCLGASQLHAAAPCPADIVADIATAHALRSCAATQDALREQLLRAVSRDR